jgi:adenylate cyclase
MTAKGDLSENKTAKYLLGHILVDQKVLNENDLNAAIDEQKKSSGPLGELLVKRGLVSRQDIIDALSIQEFNRCLPDQDLADKSAGGRLKNMRIPISIKLAMVITALIVAIMIIASAFFYYNQRDEFIAQSMRFGDAIAINLSRNAAVALLENDEASLNILLQEVSKMQDIHHAIILNKEGIIKAHSDIQKIDKPYSPIVNAELITKNEKNELTKYKDNGKAILDFSTPVLFNNTFLGTIHLGISLDAIHNKITRFGIMLLILTSALTAVGIWVSFLMSARLSRPIVDLVRGTNEIKQGNFSFRTKKRNNDELGDLSVAFNDMAEGLRKKEIIQNAFGKYVNHEIMDLILNKPDSFLGGENRLTTIMMTDLRGFTAISETLPAKDVLKIVNIYLETMTEVVLKYNGTIIEFIGDAILAVFGAPIFREDDAKRAVACAIEMQNAMAEVNARCRELGYPEVEQGIGLNTGETVVGSIGSDKRTKYGLVGKNVNLTGRIESYSVGGQILISESTAEACGPILKIHKTLEVMPKGVKKPILIFDIKGITGDFNVSMPIKATAELIELRKGLPIVFFALEGKYATKEYYKGIMNRLNSNEAIIKSETLPEPLSNIKFTIVAEEDKENAADLYAKVIESPSDGPLTFKIYFTSVPLDARNYLNKVMLNYNMN